MNHSSAINAVINSFKPLAEKIGAGAVTLLQVSDAGLSSIFHVAVREKFVSVQPDSFREKIGDFPGPEGNRISLAMKNEAGKDITCTILIAGRKSEQPLFLVLQTEAAIPADGDASIFMLAGVIGLIEDIYSGGEGPAVSEGDKYKRELLKLREAQANLFPKFKDINGMDIASAFLPADIVSGNFIDGFFLDETIYQIVVCYLGSNDPSSTFAGAAIRTLVRSEASKKMAPSVLMEYINSKLKNILSGVHALINVSVYQINTKTGKTTLSSYGPLTTIFYNSRKKGYANLSRTEVGKMLAKRNFYKDVTLPLESGDMLLFYSNGVVSASSDDGKELFGEPRLYENFMKQKEEPSVEIVQNLLDELYTFTNYMPLEEDFILLCIKKI